MNKTNDRNKVQITVGTEIVMVHKNNEILEYIGKCEITKELIEVFDIERKKLQNQERSRRNNIAKISVDEFTKYKAIVSAVNVEQEVVINTEFERVKEILKNILTVSQLRRYMLKNYYDLTNAEISRKEKVAEMSVKDSLDNADKKIKKEFQKRP